VLTHREAQCLRLAVDGLQNKEIVEVLGITARQVVTHLGLAFRKAGLIDRRDATMKWVSGEMSPGLTRQLQRVFDELPPGELSGF
jgi:DNA-binding CsgD family transcriptional regulator